MEIMRGARYLFVVQQTLTIVSIIEWMMYTFTSVTVYYEWKQFISPKQLPVLTQGLALTASKSKA